MCRHDDSARSGQDPPHSSELVIDRRPYSTTTLHTSRCGFPLLETTLRAGWCRRRQCSASAPTSRAAATADPDPCPSVARTDPAARSGRLTSLIRATPRRLRARHRRTIRTQARWVPEVRPLLPAWETPCPLVVHHGTRLLMTQPVTARRPEAAGPEVAADPPAALGLIIAASQAAAAHSTLPSLEVALSRD